MKLKNIDKAHEEVIANFGALGYTADKIASILDYDLNDVLCDLNDVNSNLFKLYIKGKNMSEYLIDVKLFELAKSGDIKALEKLESRKRRK